MSALTVRQRADEIYAPQIFTRSELTAMGFTSHTIRSAVADGVLRRLRRDRYARPHVREDIAEAVRIGGRLSCTSLLAALGIFVHVRNGLHVHVAPGTSRIRSPHATSTVLHWHGWSQSTCPSHVSPVADALAQAIRCQRPRASVATVDSVLHHGLLTREEVEEVFGRLPRRFDAVLALVDPSAASGPETFVRLMLRSLGLAFETQVWIRGVGYVDFLVEGWLIIECDSREFHGGWEAQVRDRQRDAAAAMTGHITLRLLASDILREDPQIRQTVLAIVSAFSTRLRSPAFTTPQQRGPTGRTAAR